MRGKHIVWTCIIAMLLTSLAAVGITISPSYPIVAVEPMNSTGSVGQSFTVDINIYDVDASQSLYGWDMHIRFNEDVINVVSVDRGPFLESAGTTAWQIWEYMHPGEVFGVIDNTVGVIVWGDTLTPLPGAGASGDGTLFSITFSIEADGVSQIHFEMSELYSIISGNPIDLSHSTIDGLFDNREANTLPVAQFEGPMSGVEGQSYTFTSTSYDPDGWLVGEVWDFGDGTNASGPVVSHAFAAGINTVTLTVTDGPDGETKVATMDIDIAEWMEGGWVPDLVGWWAKPEHPDLNEAYGDRTLNLLGYVGNPTEEAYEAYVEFKLFSKDEVTLLGNLNTDVATINPGESATLSAEFDTANPQWRCFSGGEWVVYGYVHYFMHKYVGFASCYYRLVGETEWTQAYVSKYISFHVKSVRHDIGIVDMWTNVTTCNPGDPVLVSVNVTNEGAMTETFTVSIYYEDVTIEDIEVTLNPGEFQVLTTTWDTTGIPLGIYVVKADLTLLAYERDATDQSDYCVVKVEAPP